MTEADRKDLDGPSGVEWLVHSKATESWYPCDSEDEARDILTIRNSMQFDKIAKRTINVEVEVFYS